jgi:hypothetical protein
MLNGHGERRERREMGTNQPAGRKTTAFTWPNARVEEYDLWARIWPYLGWPSVGTQMRNGEAECGAEIRKGAKALRGPQPPLPHIFRRIAPFSSSPFCGHFQSISFCGNMREILSLLLLIVKKEYFNVKKRLFS